MLLSKCGRKPRVEGLRLQLPFLSVADPGPQRRPFLLLPAPSNSPSRNLSSVPALPSLARELIHGLFRSLDMCVPSPHDSPNVCINVESLQQQFLSTFFMELTQVNNIELNSQNVLESNIFIDSADQKKCNYFSAVI